MYSTRLISPAVCSIGLALAPFCAWDATLATDRQHSIDVRPLRKGESRDKLKLVVQACMPQRHVSFDVLPADLTNEPMPPTFGERLQDPAARSNWPSWSPIPEVDEVLDAEHRAERPLVRAEIRRVRTAPDEDLDKATVLRTGEIQTTHDSYKVHSEGSGSAYLRGATVVGQPVFEDGRYER